MPAAAGSLLPALEFCSCESALMDLIARLLFEMLPQQLQRVSVALQAFARNGGEAG